MKRDLFWRLLTAGAGLAVALGALPQAALAEKPQPCCTTVVITDKGFDKPVYYIGVGGGTHDADQGSVTFINQGTRVHGAVTVPGTLDQGVMFSTFVDQNGTTTACWTGGANTCGNSTPLDTGGIPPGGKVIFGFGPLDLPTDYIFTSPTDCLSGNSNPDFNCTPSKIHVSDNETGLTPLSKSLSGSWILPVGDPLCRTDLLPITPSIGPAFCYAKYGVAGRIEGSSKHPVGDHATIHITDFGYDPAVVYITVPGTVTWINDGQRVHTVTGPTSQGPNDFKMLDSQGLGPGESYTYVFNTYAADDPAAPSTSFSSKVDLDLLPPNFGNTGINSNDWVPHCSTKKHLSCGSALMRGKVNLVDPNAP